jgi:DNA helicase-2/ATP-dependent DNA helicase PcrA
MPAQPSLFLREIDKNFLQTDVRIAGYGQTRQSGNMFRRRSFNPMNLNTAARSSEIEERSGWRRGQRLFHDDYGYGAVTEVRDSDDGPVVRVIFETGKETRFLSEIQGRAFEKIGDDC